MAVANVIETAVVKGVANGFFREPVALVRNADRPRVGSYSDDALGTTTGLQEIADVHRVHRVHRANPG